MKNRLADEEEELSKVSSAAQRESAIELAKKAEEWLEETANAATPVTEYKDHLKAITTVADAIFTRFSELTARPQAIKKVNSAILQLRTAISTWSEKLPQITKNETEQMLASIQQVEEWIEAKQALQSTHDPTLAPLFNSTETLLQLKPVQALYEKLIRKPKPPPAQEKVGFQVIILCIIAVYSFLYF